MSYPPTPIEFGGSASGFIHLKPKLKAGLDALREAWEYVQESGADVWEFAVELSVMRRIGLSNSDLRYLIRNGLISHAVEITPAEAHERQFQHPPHLLIGKRTCFVLTAAGLQQFTQDNRQSIDNSDQLMLWTHLGATDKTSAAMQRPKWDNDRQELRTGTLVIKSFKSPAPNQTLVLAAFEEEGWPARIDDPLPPHPDQSPKRRLQETIKSLNRNQKRAIIRFFGDGSGRGIRWDFRDRA